MKIFLYVAGGLLTWALVSRIRYLQLQGLRPSTTAKDKIFDFILSCIPGLLAGAFWPVTLPFGLIDAYDFITKAEEGGEDKEG